MLCLEHGIIHPSGELQDSFTHILTRLTRIKLVYHRVIINRHNPQLSEAVDMADSLGKQSLGCWGIKQVAVPTKCLQVGTR